MRGMLSTTMIAIKTGEKKLSIIKVAPCVILSSAGSSLLVHHTVVASNCSNTTLRDPKPILIDHLVVKKPPPV